MSGDWGNNGKTYGDDKDFPVLCIHGGLDNCDTISRLIHLLPKHFYYVSIDVFGHGKSSHIPPGYMIPLMDIIMCFKWVMHQFNWTKLHFLGHSYGAIMGLYFASVFPEHVLKLVLMDPFAVGTLDDITELKEDFLKLLEMEKRMSERKPPSYSLEEAVDKLINSRGTNIKADDVECFIERSLVKTEFNKYTFTADQRLKIRPVQLSKEQIVAVLNEISCPVLVLKSKQTNIEIEFFSSESEFYLNILRNKRNVSILNIDGDHDVHITHPERLAPFIQSFIVYQSCHL